MAIFSASSKQEDAALAVSDLTTSLGNQPYALILFFCSTRYDLQQLGASLEAAFPGASVLGCSSAGELSNQGYRDDSITAIGFDSADNFVAESLVNNIAEFSLADSQELVDQLVFQCESQGVAHTNNHTLAISLLDGLSILEEQFLQVVNACLGHIPLLGGSAGDDLHFDHTELYYHGQIHSNAAILILINTRHPFTPFSHHHLLPKQEKLVVTAADTRQRRVFELNGLPAAEEYARLCGCNTNELSEMHFALHPLTIKIGDNYYARSVQQAHTDQSLSFYSAIEIGLVLTAATAGQLVELTQQWLDEAQQSSGAVELVLTFDCILRRLEIQQKKLLPAMNKILATYKLAGFSTYGEQMGGSHLNHTFTGVYFGALKHEQ